jgi:hypothetical protein
MLTVIIRSFGKFKKLTTGKRNLHFIEIKGFGKKVKLFDRKDIPQDVVVPPSFCHAKIADSEVNMKSEFY